MAKVKKPKAKGAEQPTKAQPAEPAAVPAVVALHPSGHGMHAQASFAQAGHAGGHWPASAHDTQEEEEQDDGWGDGAADSGNLWGAPAPSDRHSGDDWGGSAGGGGGDYGAATDGGWGEPTGGDWGQAPSAATEWGQPPAAAAATPSNGLGMYGMGRGSLKRGGAHAQSPTTASAQAPASLHPTAVQMSPSNWGTRPAPTASGWGQPPTAAWGQPPAPRATAAKPAWANWASEAKMGGSSQPAAAPAAYAYQAQSATVGGGTRQVLSEHQRSQILSSLLEDPNQQAKGYYQQPLPQHHRQQAAAHPSSRLQQSLHPAQLEAQLLAEQQGILRSIQDHNARSGGRAPHGHPQQQHGRPQPVQYVDSWNQWGNNGWGADRASTIPEEEEEEEYEDDEWEDDEDDGWGGGGQEHGGHGHSYGNNQRVRFNNNVDYARSTSTTTSRGRAHAPAPAPGTSPPRNAQHQMWTPSPVSRTMKMATGTITSISGTMKTTIFELAPPRNGMGENAFVDSHGEALILAESALYNRERPAKERFRWGFNPDKDPRVGSLLKWVAAMSNGLASIGVQRFLETRERGALFANADYRTPTFSGTGFQPAFDWLTLSELQNTLDSTLQSSVTLYDPAFQVIVFVFLLSPSGKSMAVWRRKLNVPDALRDAHRNEILAVKAELKRTYPVYVDELPVEPDAATPTGTKKKKVRFAFIRRIFGGGKKKEANAA